MDDRTVGLLLKAIRTLPQRDQDRVLAALVGSAMRGPGWFRVPASPPGAVAGVPVTEPVPPDVLMMHGPGPFAIGRAPEPSGPFAMLPVRLPPELHERLRRWSNERGFSMAAIVRGLVERFLDEQAGTAPAGKATRRKSPKRAGATRAAAKRPRARG